MTTSRGISNVLAVAAVAASGCVDSSGGSERDPGAGATSSVEQAVTCSQNGCNGVDPNTTPCATGAVTIATTSIVRSGTSVVIGQVELRWSQSCGTNWSRVTRTDGAFAEGMIATVTRSGGPSFTDSKTGFTTIWSPMVYAPVVCSSAFGLIDESFTSGSATTPCL